MLTDFDRSRLTLPLHCLIVEIVHYNMGSGWRIDCPFLCRVGSDWVILARVGHLVPITHRWEGMPGAEVVEQVIRTNCAVITWHVDCYKGEEVHRLGRRGHGGCTACPVLGRSGVHRSADGTSVVSVATEHERRGDGPYLGRLGEGGGLRRLGLGRSCGHTGENKQTVDAPQVVQPPYAPELNPVECFFRELRRAIKGRVYPCRPRKRPLNRS